MNILPIEKKIQILNCLVEGNSIRSTERMTGVHRDTIMRLLCKVGLHCAAIMDEKITDLEVKQIQVDEIFCYVQKKQKRVTENDDPLTVGDQYIFVAIDADTKLVPSFTVGKRNYENAEAIMKDLQWRIKNRFQLTTDGFRVYPEAVERAFGSNVDFSQLVKVYSGDEAKRERYSPSDFVSSYKTPIMGDPDLEKTSTSYVERQNLTMRMQMRRLTRLTNAFSKKLSNLIAAVALHFAHYNFIRVHRTLKTTPAMAAGITDHIWTWEELLAI